MWKSVSTGSPKILSYTSVETSFLRYMVWFDDYFFFRSFNLPISRLMETRWCTILYLIINRRCAFPVTTSAGKSVLSMRLMKSNEWNFQRLNTQLYGHGPNLCNLHQVPALFFCWAYRSDSMTKFSKAGREQVLYLQLPGGRHNTLFTFKLRLMKTCTL